MEKVGDFGKVVTDVLDLEGQVGLAETGSSLFFFLQRKDVKVGKLGPGKEM